jgi:hypothetical protein
MTGERSSGVDAESDHDVFERKVDWEVPEIAAIVILTAVGILILGGLATGIAAAAGSQGAFGPGAGDVLAGASIQVGAEWAEPVLAIVLLGVLGLCWWHVSAWSGVPDHAPSQVASRIRRARQIARWANGTLLLTLAGSIALLVGEVLTYSQSHRSSLIWSHYIYEGASTLAVAVITTGGLWASTRLEAEPDAGTDGIVD